MTALGKDAAFWHDRGLSEEQAPRRQTLEAEVSVAEHVPTETPGADWPGPTVEASNSAWPSGRQPRRMDSWPHTKVNGSTEYHDCWKKTVLQDHDRGWPGVCLRLMHVKRISEMSECQALCWWEPRCPVWQFVNQTVPGQCWAGFGQDCVWRNGKPDTIMVQAAQRIMHGEVRVLKNMSGWKIHNLYQIGMFFEADVELSVLRCKAWCYSNIFCQYWQYGAGGCWVDFPPFTSRANPDKKVQYPLTTNGGATRQGQEATDMLWGEYLQHYCPPQQQAPTSAPVLGSSGPTKSVDLTDDSGGAIPWWGIGALFAVGACLLFCFFYGLLFGGGRKKSSSSSSSSRSRQAQVIDSDEDKPLVGMEELSSEELRDSYSAEPPPPPPPAAGGGFGCGGARKLHPGSGYDNQDIFPALPSMPSEILAGSPYYRGLPGPESRSPPAAALVDSRWSQSWQTPWGSSPLQRPPRVAAYPNPPVAWLR